MVTTTAIGLAVVKLEPVSFTTSPTVVRNESALISITFTDSAFDRRRNIT
jgi:hypothetical protein